MPVLLKGEAPGVKLQGGILEQMLREVEVECLPADIPGHIDADVSQLVFGQTLRVSDLPHSDKIKFITDENQAVAHVTAVKEVVAATPAEGAEAAATTAEPEVIKKGKQETEGEAARGRRRRKGREVREEEVSVVKLIVGLGNPGIEYQFTPHNMGFLAVDRIAEQAGVRVNNRNCRAQTGAGVLDGQEVVLAKPETYMNLSGASVRELVREYEAQPEQDLIVIYDELDLPFGSMRVRPRGSSAGHNGIASVIGALGTQEIMRIRLGVGPDHPVGDGARYVLSQFKKAQYPVLDEVLDSAAEAVRVILKEGMQAAMNRFNRKDRRSS